MSKIFSVIKPYLRWFILGSIAFFLLKAFKDNWQGVEAELLAINTQGWLKLMIALCFNMIAHCWSAFVWTWILKIFKQSISKWQAIKVYLLTNMAKYLPGNIWHFYGRIKAVTNAGGTLGTATVSVLLEPLLMAAAALVTALICGFLSQYDSSFWFWSVQILVLTGVLISIHPRFLNPVIHLLTRLKTKTHNADNVEIKTYPFLPLIGEMGYVIFRAFAFLFTLFTFSAIAYNQVPIIISIFSLSWLLGLIVPGAPGGMGIFEFATLKLLQIDSLPTVVILTAIAIFRILSIIGETIPAVIVWLEDRIIQKLKI